MFSPVIDPEANNLIDFPQLTGTPERRLLLAVLERAILDYVGNDGLEIAAAEDWLFPQESADTSLGEFTFEWVCHHLDLESERIGQIIKAMPRRGKNRVAPWYFGKASKQRLALA